MIPGYAQTNIQLFNQLQREGYSTTDLGLIHDAYEVAKQLFTGYFIASGRTQIAHVVGTASILASLRMPGQVIAAGLIHNVYAAGDFGDGRPGTSKAKRREIRRAVGATVEEHAYRFPNVANMGPCSHSQPASTSWNQPDSLDPIDRQVLLIALAEQLEHRLNFELHEFLEPETAEQLGFPALAAQMRAASTPPASAKFIIELSTRSATRSRVIAPSSYYRAPVVALRQELSRVTKRLRRLAGRLRRIAAGGSRTRS